MKKFFATAFLALGVVSLSACGSEPAAPEEQGTTVPAGDEWTATPDEGVDVNLPETPVTTEDQSSSGG